MTAPERGTATPAPELARRVGHVGARSPVAPADYAIDPLDVLPA